MRRSISSAVKDSGSEAETANRSVISFGTAAPAASSLLQQRGNPFRDRGVDLVDRIEELLDLRVRGIHPLKTVGDFVGVAQPFQLGQVVPQLAERGFDQCPSLRGHARRRIASQMFETWMTFQVDEFRRYVGESQHVRHQS